MGEVYMARIVGAHGFERPIVIKVIRTELIADERVALMFVDEARIAAGLHHRNIVQIIDFDLFDGGAFIACEHVAGCNLLDVMTHLRAPPRYDIAAAIIAELATGLDAAHEQTDDHGAPLGLVHRDVSPSNVLLGVHGEVKIADFGVAKARSRSYHTVRDMVGELDALAAQRRWSSSRAAIGDLVRLIQARVASERRAATVRDPGVRA